MTSAGRRTNLIAGIKVLLRIGRSNRSSTGSDLAPRRLSTAVGLAYSRAASSALSQDTELQLCE